AAAADGVHGRDAEADRRVPGRFGWMTQYWFKPMSHGYGATPANWKGRVASLAFLDLVFLVPCLRVASQQNPGSTLGGWVIGVWALMVAVLVAGFVWLARAKTDGEWKWRW